jgi:hypothetical protein
VWQWRRGCNRGYSDQFTCSAISAKGSTSEWKCGTACARPCQRRPRPARLPASSRGDASGPAPAVSRSTRRPPGLAWPRRSSPRHVVAAPEYPTAATLASAACCAVMRAHEEPRIVVVRRPPPALPRACVGYNRRRGLGCVAAGIVDATREVAPWQARPSGRASVVLVRVFPHGRPVLDIRPLQP